MSNISPHVLMGLVIAADEEAFAEGANPKQRSLIVIKKVMSRLGYRDYIFAGAGTPEIVNQIVSIHASLYRNSDLAVGGVHGGIFMFRDVFARIDVPIIYGAPSIDPFKLTDLSPTQIDWLRSRPGDANMFVDQFIDVFDFAGGIGNFADFKTPPGEALKLFWLAAFQFQAAAAALCVAFDSRGATQSALIGVELALKGGLAAIGKSENERKRHGHNLISAAATYAEAMPNFDITRINKALEQMPQYVENRYSPNQPGRRETGRIVMGAQFVAGEVMRHITNFSIRPSMTPPVSRSYP